jgi:hypothetical protein
VKHLSEGDPKLEIRYMIMTKTLLSGLSALAGLAVLGRAFEGAEASATRHHEGFGGALLDMLRRDATNFEYLMHGFKPASARERRWEGTESEERI